MGERWRGRGGKGGGGGGVGGGNTGGQFLMSVLLSSRSTFSQPFKEKMHK